MLKGADKLQDFYLLFFPVNEVPVICEDSSASLPELQEDRCWKTRTKKFALRPKQSPGWDYMAPTKH